MVEVYRMGMFGQENMFKKAHCTEKKDLKGMDKKNDKLADLSRLLRTS